MSTPVSQERSPRALPPHAFKVGNDTFYALDSATQQPITDRKILNIYKKHFTNLAKKLARFSEYDDITLNQDGSPRAGTKRDGSTIRFPSPDQAPGPVKRTTESFRRTVTPPSPAVSPREVLPPPPPHPVLSHFSKIPPGKPISARQAYYVDELLQELNRAVDKAVAEDKVPWLVNNDSLMDKLFEMLKFQDPEKLIGLLSESEQGHKPFYRQLLSTDELPDDPMERSCLLTIFRYALAQPGLRLFDSEYFLPFLSDLYNKPVVLCQNGQQLKTVYPYGVKVEVRPEHLRNCIVICYDRDSYTEVDNSQYMSISLTPPKLYHHDDMQDFLVRTHNWIATDNPLAALASQEDGKTEEVIRSDICKFIQENFDALAANQEYLDDLVYPDLKKIDQTTLFRLLKRENFSDYEIDSIKKAFAAGHLPNVVSEESQKLRMRFVDAFHTYMSKTTDLSKLNPYHMVFLYSHNRDIIVHEQAENRHTFEGQKPEDLSPIDLQSFSIIRIGKDGSIRGIDRAKMGIGTCPTGIPVMHQAQRFDDYIDDTVPGDGDCGPESLVRALRAKNPEEWEDRTATDVRERVQTYLQDWAQVSRHAWSEDQHRLYKNIEEDITRLIIPKDDQKKICAKYGHREDIEKGTEKEILEFYANLIGTPKIWVTDVFFTIASQALDTPIALIGSIRDDQNHVIMSASPGLKANEAVYVYFQGAHYAAIIPDEAFIKEVDPLITQFITQVHRPPQPAEKYSRFQKIVIDSSTVQGWEQHSAESGSGPVDALASQIGMNGQQLRQKMRSDLQDPAQAAYFKEPKNQELFFKVMRDLSDLSFENVLEATERVSGRGSGRPLFTDKEKRGLRRIRAGGSVPQSKNDQNLMITFISKFVSLDRWLTLIEDNFYQLASNLLRRPIVIKDERARIGAEVPAEVQARADSPYRAYDPPSEYIPYTLQPEKCLIVRKKEDGLYSPPSVAAPQAPVQPTISSAADNFLQKPELQWRLADNIYAALASQLSQPDGEIDEATVVALCNPPRGNWKRFVDYFSTSREEMQRRKLTTKAILQKVSDYATKPIVVYNKDTKKSEVYYPNNEKLAELSPKDCLFIGTDHGRNYWSLDREAEGVDTMRRFVTPAAASPRAETPRERERHDRSPRHSSGSERRAFV